MHKKMIVSILVLSALLVVACSFNFDLGKKVTRGSGLVVSEDHVVSGFTKVTINGAGSLILTQSGQESLRIEAEDNLIGRITSEVKGDTLEISFDKDLLDNVILPTKAINFYLDVISLEEIKIDGAAKVETDSLQVDVLTIEVNGAAQINMEDVQASSLYLKMSGGGDFEISGTAGDLTIEVDGAGKVDVSNLQCASASVTINGAAAVDVWATETLDVKISGAGTVGYYGDPALTQDIEGLSSIKKKGDR